MNAFTGFSAHNSKFLNKVTVMMLIRLLILFLFVCLQFNLTAQNQFPDSTDNKQIPGKIIQSYFTEVGDNTPLYNGTEYTMPYHGVTGTPFYASDSFQNGTIIYDGVKYNNVKMAYDLVIDGLIIKAYHDLNLKLVTEKINSFSFSNHMFVRIEHDSTTSKMRTGFYEVIYNGSVTVLSKRKKQLENSFRAEDPYKFAEYEYNYIKKGDNYFIIDNKNSLIEVFGDQKDEIKKFIRKNKIKLKKRKGDNIVKTAQYYEQLKK